MIPRRVEEIVSRLLREFGPESPDKAGNPRLYVGAQRKDGRFLVQYVFPSSGQKIHAVISPEELEKEKTRGRYDIYPMSPSIPRRDYGESLTEGASFFLKVGQPENDQTPYYDKIVQALNKEFFRIKAANPQGYMDEFESRLENLATEIAQSLGGKVEFKGENDMTFTFGSASNRRWS